MNEWILLAACCILAVVGYVVWQRWELTQFGITHYEVVSKKLKSCHRAVVLADLHGFFYGKDNQRLLAAIESLKPDVILIAGDLVVSREIETYDRALVTLKELVKIAPVYYGLGNHESRAARPGLVVEKDFVGYRKRVEELGVQILDNRSCQVQLGEDVIRISGLELCLSYYERGNRILMAEDCITDYLGDAAKEELQLLLAHNPAYSEAYAAWGADICFCGHNHGGLIRIPKIGGILTPQLKLFPKYGEGIHEIQGKYVITSRGLGTHTFHIRIFNRAELVCVEMQAES